MEQSKLRILTANQKGSAILIVIALIGMLTGVGIMSVDRATTDIDLAYNQLQSDRAFYIAEAGLQRAIAELRNDDSWRYLYLILLMPSAPRLLLHKMPCLRAADYTTDQYQSSSG